MNSSNMKRSSWLSVTPIALRVSLLNDRSRTLQAVRVGAAKVDLIH